MSEQVKQIENTVEETVVDNVAQAVENTVENVSEVVNNTCLLYTSPSPRDRQKSRMPSSA